jgi:hypothetical protein
MKSGLSYGWVSTIDTLVMVRLRPQQLRLMPSDDSLPRIVGSGFDPEPSTDEPGRTLLEHEDVIGSEVKVLRVTAAAMLPEFVLPRYDHRITTTG